MAPTRIGNSSPPFESVSNGLKDKTVAGSIPAPLKALFGFDNHREGYTHWSCGLVNLGSDQSKWEANHIKNHSAQDALPAFVERGRGPGPEKRGAF